MGTMKNPLKIDLNPQFRRALELMEETKQHVFVTGRAGTGATHVCHARPAAARTASIPAVRVLTDLDMCSFPSSAGAIQCVPRPLRCQLPAGFRGSFRGSFRGHSVFAGYVRLAPVCARPWRVSPHVIPIEEVVRGFR